MSVPGLSWRFGAALIAAVNLAGPTASAHAAVPAGPVGVAQTQTWHVTSPQCSIVQSWRKQPGALEPTSVTFTGTVSCASVPPNLTVIGEIDVLDTNAEARNALDAPAVVSANGGMSQSPSPQSFSLQRVLTPVPALHDYAFEFYVSFVEQSDPYFVDGVSGTPPQCTTHNNDPFADGPPSWLPPTVDCQFVESVATL
jgi:hypothetical protein